MKTSSKIPRGFMILTAIVVPTLSWWGSWRYYNATKQAESEVTAKEDASKNVSELIRELGELNKRYAEWPQQSEEMKKLLAEIKQKREEIQRRIPRPKSIDIGALPPESIEFAKMPMRSTWNGQTDPDSLWHDQRRQANQILMEHGLPTLDERGSLPDSPSLPRSPQVGGQK